MLDGTLHLQVIDDILAPGHAQHDRVAQSDAAPAQAVLAEQPDQLVGVLELGEDKTGGGTSGGLAAVGTTAGEEVPVHLVRGPAVGGQPLGSELGLEVNEVVGDPVVMVQVEGGLEGPGAAAAVGLEDVVDAVVHELGADEGITVVTVHDGGGLSDPPGLVEVPQVIDGEAGDLTEGEDAGAVDEALVGGGEGSVDGLLTTGQACTVHLGGWWESWLETV